MSRLVLGLIAATVLVLVLAFPSLISAQEKPAFKLGFKALADQVPLVVGEPLENEHAAANGNSEQRTSKGLMAWRKADNWTAFTDGYRSWVLGPAAVRERGNDERFSWEAAEQGTRLVEEPVGLPARLRIPAIGVDAEFEFVGLTPDGAMETPKDPDKVAWYSAGPRPGAPGNAVVTGHVDWGGKLRAFWRLKELKPEDTIEVLAEDRTFRFAVQWSRWYDADESFLDDVFGSTNAPEITLITCGGEFDQQTRQYLSRMVVRAVLQYPLGVPHGS